RELSSRTDRAPRSHHRLAPSRLSAVPERLLRRWQMAELIIPQGDRSGHLYGYDFIALAGTRAWRLKRSIERMTLFLAGCMLGYASKERDNDVSAKGTKVGLGPCGGCVGGSAGRGCRAYRLSDCRPSRICYLFHD